MTQFKPLLAVQAEFDKVDFTDMWLSPKLDGVRAIVIDGVVMSRNLKPIPNRHVQSLFKHLEYYDGELIAGSPTSPSAYRDTASAVMSADGEPDVTFYVFDHIENPNADYAERHAKLKDEPHVSVLAQEPVNSLTLMESVEQSYLALGFEGVMIRKAWGPNSKYKFGRATAKSNTLLKVKRMSSDEAEIVEIIELEHNENEAVTNALGHTERSSHKENKVPGGVMGALRVRCIHSGIEFQIGTGFTADDRVWFWENKTQAIGKFVTYNHFSIGRKDLPRFPSYKGLRSVEDM